MLFQAAGKTKEVNLVTLLETNIYVFDLLVLVSFHIFKMFSEKKEGGGKFASRTVEVFLMLAK